MAELCTEFKCNGIKASIRQTLEAFKRQFWSSLPENRRQDADFGRLSSVRTGRCFACVHSARPGVHGHRLHKWRPFALARRLQPLTGRCCVLGADPFSQSSLST